MLKPGIELIKINGINYIKKEGKIIKNKPWIGGIFSFLYDSMMAGSVFPKKFEASIEKHLQYLKDQYSSIHNCSVLELAAGSGSISKVLPNDNRYTGIDISKGLLKIAYKKFIRAGFNEPQLFVCGAEDLPFEDRQFDVCICNLSLNFFADIAKVIKEIKRVLREKGIFFCCIAVPERNKKQSIIRGKIYSESELKDMFEKNGFEFTSFDISNGALLYFKARLKN